MSTMRADLLGAQRMEHHDVVDAVDELGPEVLLHDLHHRGLHARVVASRPPARWITFEPRLRGHDDHGVAEIDRAALAVGQAAVVEHLQQHVEHVRVRLLDLVEQDHGIRPAAHRLGEIAALLVADIARRRADQPRHGVLLHELGHVDAHHGFFGIEQELGQRLAQLGLAHAGGAEEQERAVRPARIGQAGARAADGVRRRCARASSWPTTRLPSASSMRSSLSFSPSSILETGMPVHFETTSAISSSVTLLRTSWVSLLLGGLRLRRASSPARESCRTAARPSATGRCARRAASSSSFLRFSSSSLIVARALQRGLLGLPDLLEVGVFLLQRAQASPRASPGASSRPRRLPSSAPPARSSAG